MARKRAPGGGRKRIGRSVARPLTIRIDDDLRGRLERAAQGRGQRRKWNLSAEILHRLRTSLDKDREIKRDPAINAICFLIADMAKRELYTDIFPSTAPWHRDPFTFRAFKLAVAELLNDLEPAGDMFAPPSLSKTLGRGPPFETPDQLGGYAASKEKIVLRLLTPLNRDEAADWLRTHAAEAIDDLDEDIYRWAQIRRLFNITEPEERP